MTTLLQWTTNTASLVMGALPTHDLEGASSLVSAWLTANGGWEPDDEDFPEDAGAPSGGQTEAQAAALIVDARLLTVEQIEVSWAPVLTARIVGRFEPGLTAAEKAAIVVGHFTARLTRRLEGSPIEVTSNGEAQITASSSVRANGKYAVGDVAAINASYDAIEPEKIALDHAKSIFNLDNTWGCTQAYARDNDPDSPIAFTVKKFTTTGLTTLQASMPSYVVTIDRVTGRPRSLTRIEP